jgi:Flp pilus assembly protein CpaB
VSLLRGAGGRPRKYVLLRVYRSRKVVLPRERVSRRPAEEHLMKSGNKLFIFAGVGLALVAILLGVVSMSGDKKANAEKPAQSTKVKIVQAKVDIPAHQILTITDLGVVEVSSADAPADAVKSLNAAVGLAYHDSLTTGQNLVTSELEVPGLQNDIAPGKRAIALPVDQVSLMSGLLQDGDYIDLVFHVRLALNVALPSGVPLNQQTIDKVLGSAAGVDVTPDATTPTAKKGQSPDAAETSATASPQIWAMVVDDIGDQAALQPIVKIMLQDIKVLRVISPGDSYLGNGAKDSAAGDSTSSGGGDKAKSTGQVILEVTPKQAEFVNFIQDQHISYQLIVRAKDDHATVSTDGVTYNTLVSDPEWGLPMPKAIQIPLPSTVNPSTEASPVAAEPTATPAAAEPTSEPSS